MKKVILPLLGFLVFLGCSKETPKLYGRPGVQQKNTDVTFDREDLNPAVDILFIVDDSGSMLQHQRNLSSNVDLFLQEFQNSKDIDYHIGVITSDNFSSNKGGRLQGTPTFVSRNTPNGLALLRSRLVPGTSGSGFEQVFDPVVNALSVPLLTGHNKDFFRPKAHFALVVITDAEEQSTSFSGPDFHNWMVNLKGGDVSKLSYYGAYIPVSDSSCYREEDEPYQLEAFFQLVKATTFGLCDRDFGSRLAGIGADLVKKVNRRILLENRPVVSTIKITFGSQLIPPDAKKGWVYNIEDNSLTFGSEIDWTSQPVGTTVSVSYLPVE